jgi:alpha,alpha-trehalase
MLFYLFSSEELRALFERLGYPFDPAMIPRTIDYYLHRTSDGSTLSRVAHAWVLARSHRAASWRIACDALASDISDIQGGTTREGIHLGAMAGSVDLIQRCYTGLELRDGVLWIKPHLPDAVRRLDVLVRYRGHALELTFSGDMLEVHALDSAFPTIKLGVRGAVIELMAGERRRFALRA